MNPSLTGLINVNTATATALACTPGHWSLTLAPQILSYRQSNPPQTPLCHLAGYRPGKQPGRHGEQNEAGPLCDAFSPSNLPPTLSPSATIPRLSPRSLRF